MKESLSFAHVPVKERRIADVLKEVKIFLEFEKE